MISSLNFKCTPPVPHTLKKTPKPRYLIQEANLIKIRNLTTKLNIPLTSNQWVQAQDDLQDILNILSSYIDQTCMAPPPLNLTHRTMLQRGFLPRKQQNEWKKTKHSPQHPQGNKMHPLHPGP